LLNQHRHDRIFVGKILIEAANADPGTLGNRVGVESIQPVATDKLSRGIDYRVLRPG
jgi:hypothetical protein